MRVTFLHIYCTREGQLVFHENWFKIISIFFGTFREWPLSLSLSLLCDSRTVQNIFKENICRFLRNSIVIRTSFNLGTNLSNLLLSSSLIFEWLYIHIFFNSHTKTNWLTLKRQYQIITKQLNIMQQLLKPFPLTIKSICTLSFTKLSKLNHIKDIKKVDTSRKKLYSSMTNVALRCAVPWTVQPITVPQSNKTSREILSVDYLRYLESLVRQAPTTG